MRLVEEQNVRYQAQTHHYIVVLWYNPETVLSSKPTNFRFFHSKLQCQSVFIVTIIWFFGY